MISGTAPEFELPAMDRSLHSLRDLVAAGPVLLAFFKITCPTCQLTMPFLNRLQQGRTADAPSVIAISQDDATATHHFNQRYGLELPVLLDPSGAAGGPRYPASNAYRITNVPSLFLVEADGKISQSFTGFDRAEIEKLGQRFGVNVFKPGDRVPAFQPG